MDGLAAPERDTPVVRIMVGDNNLDSQQACEALQRHTDDEALWEVFASPADRSGDNVAVSGASARFRPIALGYSFEDRGMRNDSHDAAAVVITLCEAKKRKDREESVPRPRSPSSPAADFCESTSEAEREASDNTENEWPMTPDLR